MKSATVEEVITSFPHPILPTVQGEPDNQTSHAIRNLLQAAAREIDTHYGGGALGHMGLNEASAALKRFFTTNDVDYQLVPPHCHRRNSSERAIRTFKEHFLQVWLQLTQIYHYTYGIGFYHKQ
jgi:hypothetical protein